MQRLSYIRSVSCNYFNAAQKINMLSLTLNIHSDTLTGSFGEALLTKHLWTSINPSPLHFSFTRSTSFSKIPTEQPYASVQLHSLSSSQHRKIELLQNDKKCTALWLPRCRRSDRLAIFLQVDTTVPRNESSCMNDGLCPWSKRTCAFLQSTSWRTNLWHFGSSFPFGEAFNVADLLGKPCLNIPFLQSLQNAMMGNVTGTDHLCKILVSSPCPIAHWNLV